MLRDISLKFSLCLGGIFHVSDIIREIKKDKMARLKLLLWFLAYALVLGLFVGQVDAAGLSTSPSWDNETAAPVEISGEPDSAPFESITFPQPSWSPQSSMESAQESVDATTYVGQATGRRWSSSFPDVSNRQLRQESGTPGFPEGAGHHYSSQSPRQLNHVGNFFSQGAGALGNVASSFGFLGSEAAGLGAQLAAHGFGAAAWAGGHVAKAFSGAAGHVAGATYKASGPSRHVTHHVARSAHRTGESVASSAVQSSKNLAHASFIAGKSFNSAKRLATSQTYHAAKQGAWNSRNNFWNGFYHWKHW